MSRLYIILVSSIIVMLDFLFSYASFKNIIIEQPDISSLTITATQVTQRNIIYQYLLFIWLIGASVCLIKNIIVENRFYKTLIANSSKITEAQVIYFKKILEKI